MSLRSLSILLSAAVLTMAGCEKKPRTTAEKVEDKIKDGLDARPNEKAKDLGEDVRDGLRKAGKDTKETIKGVAKDSKEALREATE